MSKQHDLKAQFAGLVVALTLTLAITGTALLVTSVLMPDADQGSNTCTDSALFVRTTDLSRATCPAGTRMSLQVVDSQTAVATCECQPARQDRLPPETEENRQ